MSQVGQSVWLEEVGLGLTLWSGQFEEEVTRLWLRWCDLALARYLPSADRKVRVIPTGAEGQAIERQRAEIERQRADRLAERLRKWESTQMISSAVLMIQV
jgi:hypothetical protein